MLTIRQAQLTILSRTELDKFENWMVGHLEKFFPRQYTRAGERQMRETIQHGIARAAKYGVTAKSDVCKYIDMAVVFGRDFDEDLRFAWAGEILRKARPPRLKMLTLFLAAKKHLERV